MRENIKRFLFGGENFKNEFKKQLRLLINFTLGFTIAFTWRQTIFDTTQSLVEALTHIQSSAYLSIASSIFITLFSLFVIWAVSKILEER